VKKQEKYQAVLSILGQQ